MKKTIFITALLFMTSAVITAHTGYCHNPLIDNNTSVRDSLKFVHIDYRVWDKRNNEAIDFYIGAHFIPVGNDFTRLYVFLISKRWGRFVPHSECLEDHSDYIYPKVKGPVFNRTIEYVIPDRKDPDNKVIIVKLKVKFKVTDEGSLPGMQICEAKVKYRNMSDRYYIMVRGNTRQRVFRFDEKERLIEFEDQQKNVFKM